MNNKSAKQIHAAKENVKNSLFEKVLKPILQKHIESFFCAAVELYLSMHFVVNLLFAYSLVLNREL